jgi:hypothetical protein
MDFYLPHREKKDYERGQRGSHHGCFSRSGRRDLDYTQKQQENVVSFTLHFSSMLSAIENSILLTKNQIAIVITDYGSEASYPQSFSVESSKFQICCKGFKTNKVSNEGWKKGGVKLHSYELNIVERFMKFNQDVLCVHFWFDDILLP